MGFDVGLSSREYKPIIRIAGHDVDGSLKVPYGLASIRGIGVRLGYAIAHVAGINPDRRIGFLTEDEVKRVEDVFRRPWDYGIRGFLLNRQRAPENGRDELLIGGEWELRQRMDIEFMKEIRCWKGIRHALGLKVRGQKTRTTGRKGRTVGVVRRKK
ncbi:30S ribosomal protein S13 [Candidatus Bathyarchaeota archaeon]|nr:30S ribosomal protein S13 [Candidatus Bathyarchaeota archaeon]